jgi:hypothetical protein
MVQTISSFIVIFLNKSNIYKHYLVTTYSTFYTKRTYTCFRF